MAIPTTKSFWSLIKMTTSQYAQALDQINRQTPKTFSFLLTLCPALNIGFFYTSNTQQSPTMPLATKLPPTRCVRSYASNYQNYDKNQQGLYSLLHASINSAKTNARNSLAHAQAANTDNPTSKVHLLVEYLHNMKNHRAKLQ